MILARGVLLFLPFLVACGSKWSFEDGDGDGVSAAEGDCWDKSEGPAGSGLSGDDIFPGATETWYDGIDQNCSGDDDFDADGDGFIQQIHVGMETDGVEGSGSLRPGDCWDEQAGPGDGSISGERINPDALDTWHDGIDQNCSGDDDYDSDEDGYVSDEHEGLETVPVEGSGALPAGDCADTLSGLVTVDGEIISGKQIHPGMVGADVWYDGVDQDCAGNDDFDKDGDGYRSGSMPDEYGKFGPDCLDDVADALPIEEDFRTNILATGFATPAEFNTAVLEFYELTPADFYPPPEDPEDPRYFEDEPYDGFDRDCAGDNDCDVDGDGADSAGTEAPYCPEYVLSTHPLCQVAACENIDCDDNNATIRPTDVEEIPYNGIDDNCNLEDGDGDADEDGFWSCDYATLVAGSELEPPVDKECDCNDGEFFIAPGNYDEPYDGIDGDCAGNDDFDQDLDGYAAEGYDGIVTEYVVGGGAIPGTGLLLGGDCQDLDPDVNPAMNEDCETPYDDDCDGDLNDRNSEECNTYYADRDEDGFGQPGDSKCFCEVRDEYTGTNDQDCDDSSATTYPGVASAESDASACMKDDDGDGYGDESPPGGVVAGEDCDDTVMTIRPSGTEVCDDDDIDEDCDGDSNDLDAVDCTNFYADRDGDTFGDPGDVECRCEIVGVYNQVEADDCDDTSPTAAVTHPGAAEFEESSGCHKDADGDGFGDDSSGPFTPGVDCDDDRLLVNPSVNEDCETPYDDDCDTDLNDEGAEDCDTFYADRDDDGFGKPGDSKCYCLTVDEYKEDDFDDCDDSSATTYPGAAPEDSSTACMKDDDGDDFGDMTVVSPVAPGSDCDDDLSAVNPSVNEDCETEFIDDDCDLDLNNLNADNCDPFYADRDGDSYGDPDDSQCRCDPFGVYSEPEPDDCDDGSHRTFPGAAEWESSTSCRKDEDEDGYGDASPGAGIDSGTDCDDDNPERSPAATERCSTVDIDDDCDPDGDTNDLNAIGCLPIFADIDGDLYGDPDAEECRCILTDDHPYASALDCDSSDSNTHPGAAEFESSTSCRKDSDGDGYGDDSPPAGVDAGGDCDDTPVVGVSIRPGGTEVCDDDDTDEDCDGDTNDLNAVDCTDWHKDQDGDGFGDPDATECRCGPRGVYSESDDLDCDDSTSTIHPDADESCDLVDSDCDESLIDGIYDDFDGDGQPDCADPDADGDGHSGLDDCYDLDPTMYVGAPESCDLTDSDCDGSYVDGFADEDLDGIPDCVDDEDGDGYPLEVDCDDDNAAIHPGVSSDTAVTLGVDNDCDGLIDEDTIFALLDAGEDVLIFSELQVNPQGSYSEERDNEWFELTNTTATTLYLDNWVFDMTDSDCLEDSSVCDQFTVFPGSEVQVEPGGAVLLCRAAAAMNAAMFTTTGEVCDYNYGTQPSGASGSAYYDGGYRLYNSVVSALAVSIDGEEVDAVDHSLSGWPDVLDDFPVQNEGRALMFDGALIGGSGLTDDNDLGSSWCNTRHEDYAFDMDVLGTGIHNYGTPGELNPTCDEADL
jgi:hypothetical protein